MSYSTKMTVYEGKVFQVDLQSMLWSTAYGWCLSNMPEGIVLLSTETIPLSQGIAPVIQRFHFGVMDAKAGVTNLEFVMTRVFDVKQVVDNCTVELQIIPSDANQFTSYSENDSLMKYGYPCVAHTAMPYGMIYSGNARNSAPANGSPFQSNSPFQAADLGLKYGYPCVANSAMAYGNPYPAHKYGYPCAVDSAALKYGYPCAADSAALKYGYPCAADSAALKYGYPGCF